MNIKTSFLTLILTTVILAFQCKTDSSESGASVDTLANSDSLNWVDESALNDQVLNKRKEKLQIGMEVFYRRSGGMGDKLFAGLSDGDTIHYAKGEGMMTQRVYQVTHNGRDIDSLAAINLSVYSSGRVLKTWEVDFQIQQRENNPVIIFYDGIPEPTEDLVQISFSFLDKGTGEKKEIKICMLLDLRLENLE